MKQEIAVQCRGLTKSYTLYKSYWDRIRQLIVPGKYGYRHRQDALKNIDLTLYRGEIIGIIGLNGSGKSTLSRIISGITTQTSGTVTCNGQVNMLSANIGLNDYMTGIENIRYKSTLMGLSKLQIKEQIPQIVEFADLGAYIDYPLRTYSSGMRARLGFSIAVFNIPDILIVDEALAVGDIGFAQKCAAKMKQFKDEKRKRTVLFVSHAVGQMQGFCDRIIWLHNGRIVAEDAPERLILPYCAFARDIAQMTVDEKSNFWPDLAEYQKKARIS